MTTPTQQIKTDGRFTWTEAGYQARAYCYYCKANASIHNVVRPNGYGCDNCSSYASNVREEHNK